MQLSLLLFIPCIFANNISSKSISCRLGYPSKGCPLMEMKSRDRRQINYGMRMLGEECIWTNQCRQTPVDGTKVCLAHQCQCSHGYIPIDSYRCVQDFDPVSPEISVTEPSESDPPGYGSVCSTNGDCQQATNHLQCHQGKCACLDGYVPLGKYLCYNLHKQSTWKIESSSVISTTPVMPTSTERFFANEVMKSLGKIGNSCTNDYFCRRAVPQSHCYNGKCTCSDGYISIDQYTCMRVEEETTTRSTSVQIDYKSLLGGKCSTKRNCHTFNAICLNSVCTCPKGHFAVDDWTCLREPESSDEELIDRTSIISTTSTATTTILSTTTVFRWWPWSPTPTTQQTFVTLKNSFRVRCLLNRQCASMDKNSHCTLFGRCICNPGYQLKATKRGERCMARMINEDDCD